MCDFSPSELVVIAIALDEEKETKKIKRKLWVHPILDSRKAEGEFHTLYPRLIDDETKFFNYFRINIATFASILAAIEPDLKSENKSYREVWVATDPLLVHTIALQGSCHASHRQNIFCLDRDWNVTGTARALHG